MQKNRSDWKRVEKVEKSHMCSFLARLDEVREGEGLRCFSQLINLEKIIINVINVIIAIVISLAECN